MNSKNKYIENTERLFGTDGIRGRVNGEKITTTRYIDTSHKGHIINSVKGTTPSSWLVKKRGRVYVFV